MSIECSECEHDLRGGHDRNCSRHPRNRNRTAPVVERKARATIRHREQPAHVRCPLTAHEAMQAAGVMMEFATGTPIEQRSRKGKGIWYPSDRPTWNWYACEYRISKQPKEP